MVALAAADGHFLAMERTPVVDGPVHDLDPSPWVSGSANARTDAPRILLGLGELGHERNGLRDRHGFDLRRRYRGQSGQGGQDPAQGFGQGAGVRRPFGRVFLERKEDRLFQVDRDFRPQAARRRRRFLGVVADGVGQVLDREGRVADDELKEQDSQGIDIGAGVGGLAGARSGI
jgi:hypothetical protein